MSLNKLNVPKTITVGFQERNDTYTKRLAYVIYTDAKGVLRKETSWQGWRDKKIEPEHFDNVPTSGFVFNKKVGGNKYSWNPRNTYIRVFDPRGFEFEISVPNALFILEECSSVKGKGLEGEFVYAWDGTELVLLPTCSQEYKDSTDFTNLQTKKITKNDVKEGYIFRNKDNDRVMYLGRFDWSEMNRSYEYHDDTIKRHNKYDQYTKYFVSTKKKHVFVYLDKDENFLKYQSKYWIQDGFTKLGELVSPEVSSQFAEEYDDFKSNCPNVGCEFEIEKTEYKLDLNFLSGWYYSSSFVENGKRSVIRRKDDKFYQIPNSIVEILINEKDTTCCVDFKNDLYNSSYSTDSKYLVSEEEIKNIVANHWEFKNRNNNQTLGTII
jgi:hypothetical protein